MSKSGFLDWRTQKQKIAMGEKVGRIEEFKFLKETACVHIEQREEIAWLGVYALINPDDKDFIDFLNSVAKPALVHLGRSRWYRDTITDLSLALSFRERKAKSEDTADILEAKIE